jgi:heme-degrading monooxygenase HmoA
MFVSQVIFETEKANEAMLQALMQKKAGEATGIAGLVASECWVENGRARVGFSLVTKWESREHFQTWLSREEHVKAPKEPERAAFTKTAYQFETVE